MTTVDLLLKNWEFVPSVVIGCVALVVGYFWAVKWKFDRKAFNFTAGMLIVFVALTSPLDALGDNYLFCAHMLQHMMLGIIAPVLLVPGIPESFVRTVFKVPGMKAVENFFGHPPITMAIANITFWVWHLPYLYDLTLDNETIHIVEHLLFLITGCMLWWPIFKPIPEGRLSPIAGIIYIEIAALFSTILGIIFTLSDTPYYDNYIHPNDELGCLSLIREGWGLSCIDDQKLGGAIMWEPAGAIFLWAIMRNLIDWYKEKPEGEPVGPEAENQGKADNLTDGGSENV